MGCGHSGRYGTSVIGLSDPSPLWVFLDRLLASHPWLAGLGAADLSHHAFPAAFGLPEILVSDEQVGRHAEEDVAPDAL